MHVNYDFYRGWQNITQRLDVANREEYQLLVNEASVNAGQPLKPANDPTSPLFVKNVDTDWQEEASPGTSARSFREVAYATEAGRKVAFPPKALVPPKDFW